VVPAGFCCDETAVVVAAADDDGFCCDETAGGDGCLDEKTDVGTVE
jgi:hypothetical protein